MLGSEIAERNQAIETDYRAICEVFPAFAEIASIDDFKVDPSAA